MPEISVSDLASQIEGRALGEESLVLRGIATLDDAGPEDVSFLSSKAYRANAERSAAGCVIVDSEEALPGRTVIVVEGAQLGYARAMQLFFPRQRPPAGISERAAVDGTAVLGEGLFVDAGAVIGAGCRIGSETEIHAGAVIGTGCTIGESCILYPGVVLYPDTVLGDRVIIHAGAVIGADGFGVAWAGDGFTKIPQAGNVIIGSDVEIGANTCIDRATLSATRIGQGTKIDNLTQVAHNVTIGPHSALAAQAGIAGSTTVGAGCQIAGQAGISGHLELGDRTTVLAKSAVLTSFPEGGVVAGIPAVKAFAWKRMSKALEKLPEVFRRLRRLEKSRD
ncbi:MAG: UDP-3-O-(3-hydroxymyristoyl)glucosamine N-acyltransferase [bacterium]|nr:UDP-3-O-(3-hydroxymyristoyl)glucosamine N-acyltransferase [bacterium]